MKKTEKYSTSNGKIICTYYECICVETANKTKILHGSVMNDPMTLQEIIKCWGLKKGDLEWYVVLGVDMINLHKEDENGLTMFEYKPFEIIRGGSVPDDFSYEIYRNKIKTNE